MAGLQLLAALALATVLSVQACVTFPNGTDTKANWFVCPDVDNDGKIYSVEFTDMQGKDEYPIKLTEPLEVVMKINNPGSAHKNIRLDIDIYSWGGWSGCDWHEIPTFGLLSNLDACQNGVPCPIQPGDQTLNITLDFSKYSSIIALLTDDAPYQLHYKLTDKDSKEGDLRGSSGSRKDQEVKGGSFQVYSSCVVCFCTSK
ncbi:MD-2-related lipid-recognition domain and Immunoglobulin E-set domain-containing protein [Aphelenchoides fujianensis]|nr:MD-2-related lipid-recognition domain and Immunoglobulin E-set domain-containing protein [Aphelenchoides fujianensis]